MATNFGETLTYWYLRFNGFFPIVDFVLHRDESTIEYSADYDLLAVRFPFVFEQIGGHPSDWDNKTFEDWGIDLNKNTIGLIIEVKTGRNAEIQKSFAANRLLDGIQRLGFWQADQSRTVAHELKNKCFYRDSKERVVVGKLLVAANMPSQHTIPPCLRLHLNDAHAFIIDRVNKYNDPKQADRLRFPSDLMQYIIWSRGRSQHR